MTATVAHLWRHPIKGIGAEACDSLTLTPENGVAGDRAWALLNAAADDIDAWQPRRNFLQVASGPQLSAISAVSTAQGVTLTHPDRDPLSFAPETDGAALSAWIGDLWPTDRPSPARLVKAPDAGMADMPFASVSIGNMASLRTLSQKAGFDIHMRRFRINIWLDGLAPWEEGDLLERGALQIGSATLTPVETIERCRAPDANPHSGLRDIGMLSLLEEGWNTRDFGIYCKVQGAGTVQIGDSLG